MPNYRAARSVAQKVFSTRGEGLQRRRVLFLAFWFRCLESTKRQGSAYFTVEGPCAVYHVEIRNVVDVQDYAKFIKVHVSYYMAAQNHGGCEVNENGWEYHATCEIGRQQHPTYETGRVTYVQQDITAHVTTRQAHTRPSKAAARNAKSQTRQVLASSGGGPTIACRHGFKHKRTGHTAGSDRRFMSLTKPQTHFRNGRQLRYKADALNAAASSAAC
jgi:hypothetical protein